MDAKHLQDKKVKLGDVEIFANQVANWGSEFLALKQKDTVCLMMHNRPEYASIWLGFGKIGCSTALLNTNITGLSLTHSIEVSLVSTDKKVLLIEDELASNLLPEIESLRSGGVTVYLWSEAEKLIRKVSSARPRREARSAMRESDPLVLIFTSGTTGLPKAAKMSSTRMFLVSLPMMVMCALRVGVRTYCCLPLYHGSGGVLGVCAVLQTGATMVMRKKFSASNFVRDCVKYEVNVIQYIGELCRYLLNTSVEESLAKQLKISHAIGNGLRGDVWGAFQHKFHIQNIVEFYGSTEGNIGLFNSTGKVGSLGCVPRVLDFIYPVCILKVDPHQPDTPLRDAAGRCLLAEVDEPGLVVAVVGQRMHTRFEGYSDSSATKKKILTDVFVPGDIYFNSGDLLYRDWFGFFYWSDRVGDTFRYKGENVSTTEVEHAMNKHMVQATTEAGGDIPVIDDCVVYGVAVPNTDGKAGMVAFQLNSSAVSHHSHWKELFHQACVGHLPVFARPLFVRILKRDAAITSTFKHSKVTMAREGFAPANLSGDEIYFYDQKAGQLVDLTESIHDEIVSGVIKL